MLRNKQADQTSGLQPGEAEAGRKPSVWFGPLGGWQCSLRHTGSLVYLPSICLPPGSILALWRFCSAPLLWSPWQDVSCGHSLGICSFPRLCFPTLSHRRSWDTEETLFAGVMTGGLSGSEEREGSHP